MSSRNAAKTMRLLSHAMECLGEVKQPVVGALYEAQVSLRRSPYTVDRPEPGTKEQLINLSARSARR